MNLENSNVMYTPHFSQLELIESATARKYGIDNTPTLEVVDNLRTLCANTLEPLRKALGLPIVITSGYRCKALNDLIAHHSQRSQHMEGRAADLLVQGSKFQVQGASPRELLIKAFKTIITSPEIDYDQLIIYPTFIHVSFVSHSDNRHKIMSANGQGTYRGLSRADALELN